MTHIPFSAARWGKQLQTFLEQMDLTQEIRIAQCLDFCRARDGTPQEELCTLLAGFRNTDFWRTHASQASNFIDVPCLCSNLNWSTSILLYAAGPPLATTQKLMRPDHALARTSYHGMSCFWDLWMAPCPHTLSYLSDLFGFAFASLGDVRLLDLSEPFQKACVGWCSMFSSQSSELPSFLLFGWPVGLWSL